MSDIKAQVLRDLVQKRLSWEFFGWDRFLILTGGILGLSYGLGGLFASDLMVLLGFGLSGVLALILPHQGPWATEETRGARLSLWWFCTLCISGTASWGLVSLKILSPLAGSVVGMFYLAGALGGIGLVKRRPYLGLSAGVLGLFCVLIGFFKWPIGTFSLAYGLALSLVLLLFHKKPKAP